MPRIALEDVQALLDHPKSESMSVSWYADMSAVEGLRSPWEGHLKTEARRIRQLLASDRAALEEFDQNMAVIRRALESREQRRARGRAIFSAVRLGLFRSIASDVPFMNRLIVDEEPYLVPLVEAYYRQREYLVVLTDSHRGRLYAATPESERLLCEIDEAVPRHQRSSGQRWGKQQATIARHREDHILHYLKELAQRVTKAWDEHRFHGLILCGEHEVLAQFRAQFPRLLDTYVIHEIPHSWAGPRTSICDEVRAIDAELRHVDEEELHEEVKDRLQQGYAVALGPQEVIDALRDGRAQALIFEPDRRESAARCSGCQAVFAAARGTCPYCQAACERVNLWQAILALAMRHKVGVHFVSPDANLTRHGGVVGLLTRAVRPGGNTIETPLQNKSEVKIGL